MRSAHNSARKKFKVLVSDPIDNAGIDILNTVAEVDVKTKLTEDQIVEIIGDYDAIMVRSGTTVTERIIKAGSKLKIIGRAGVGVDNVHVKSATDRGIFVVNSPLGNTVAAAEHTLGLLFAVARHIPQADASMRLGKWDRSKFMGSQLQSKTLGIIGLGQVGSHVAKVAREMGMRLVAYDPYVNAAKAAALDCQVLSVEELLKQSDFVTLHVPLIPDTKNLINSTSLRLMKPTARIVNCSRGGVIDEKALCEALKEGRLAGAALDVFEEEKAMPTDHFLLNTPNLIVTPHLGASTHEAQINVAIDVAQQIRETLVGNLPSAAVNIPGIRAAELQHLRPLISCCRMLGRIAAQLLKGPIENLTCALEGSYAEEKGEVLMLAAAQGALSAHTAVPVNFVNVRQMADSSKVLLSYGKEPQHSRAAVKVIAKSEGCVIAVKGAVSEEEGLMLLTQFADVPVYMPLPFGNEGRSYFVYSRHDDVPGTLAALTSVLGKHNVNIGDLHLGRTTDAVTNTRVGIAIASTDSDVSQHCLDEIKAMKGGREAIYFRA